MSITREDLAKHGFRFHETPTLSVNSDDARHWVGLWQKEVEVEGTSASYFVNVEEWDLSDLTLPVRLDREFSPRVQFRGEGGVQGMDVSMHIGKADTIESVLAFFERVRTAMGYCLPVAAAA